MSQSVLVAGPWVGEFGYELFRWQGHLRALAPKYDRVIVASRPGHELLYKDFADFVPVDTDPNPCEGPFNDVNLDPTPYIEKVFGHIPYYHSIHPCVKFSDSQPTKYIPFGQGSDSMPYDIVFHARGITIEDQAAMVKDHTKMKLNRNWPEESWNELVTEFHNHGFTMACIGDPRSAWKLPHCTDMRGIPLHDLADLLGNSDWIIGPSSGPMHFASLCKCKQLVWGTPHLHARYEQLWNPFGTYVRLMECDEQWNPSVGDVIYEFLKCNE